ncbi:hypothetical protein [Streptomyces sp. NPDC002537]
MTYREPGGRAGKPRQVSFKKLEDAEAFAVKVERDKDLGTYINPKAGQKTFEQVWNEWVEAGTLEEELFRASTTTTTGRSSGASPSAASRRQRSWNGRPTRGRADIPLLEVAAGGHRTTRTTELVYGHLVRRAMDRGARTIHNRLGLKLEPFKGLIAPPQLTPAEGDVEDWDDVA